VTIAPELLQWARETLPGISVLTGHGKGRLGGAKADLDPEVVAMLYRIEAELVRFLEANKTTDSGKWVPPD
jgi:hypothetical protein